MGYPSSASEFPNDNAELSSGTVWLNKELTGPPVAVCAPHAPVPTQPFVLYFDDEDPPVDGPGEIQLADGGLPTIEIHVAVAASPAEATEPGAAPKAPPLGDSAPKEPAPPGPFAHFEAALTRTLLAQGATRSAALVPKLLRLETLPADALAKDVQLTLQSRGYLDGALRYSTKFRELCGAWAAVLCGASQDFSACGTTTLDRFGAELLAALLAVPATRADELRRELRKAGIAAFGVLEAA